MDSLRIGTKSKFSQRLYATRKEQRMTADELAEAVGLNRATIYLYENGKIKSINQSILRAMAKCLNVTTDYLIGKTDDKNGVCELDNIMYDDTEDATCHKERFCMSVFAKRLKETRIERNVSIAELSEIVGLNKATLHRYENAEFKAIKFPVLKVIADYLNVTPEYLIGASDSMETDQEAQGISSNVSSDITDEEKLLLELFKQVPPESRHTFLEKMAVDVVRYSLKRNQS